MLVPPALGLVSRLARCDSGNTSRGSRPRRAHTMFTITSIAVTGTVYRDRARDERFSHRAVSYAHNPETGHSSIDCQCGRYVAGDSIDEARMLWREHIAAEARRRA